MVVELINTSYLSDLLINSFFSDDNPTAVTTENQYSENRWEWL